MSQKDQTVPDGTPSQKTRRPKWVVAVLIGYALLALATLIFPWAYLELRSDGTEGLGWPLITATVVWLLCLAGLMFVPVQMGRLRRVPRRSIWVPLIVTGFLAGVLAWAAGIALWELFDEQKTLALGWPITLGAVGVWAMWAGIFYLISRKQGQTRLALTLHRWLLAGNVLELLIAVPAHLIVRRRTNCCAGVATGTAICFGVVIVVLAFGPSVVLLYLRRFKQIQISPADPGRALNSKGNPSRLKAFEVPGLFIIYLAPPARRTPNHLESIGR